MTATPPAASSTSAGSALQAALAAEHAAIYGYGVAGAQLAGSRQAEAVRDWTAHQVTRDTLVTMLRSRGAQPVPAADAYALPFPVHSAHAAVLLAVALEDGITTTYLGLVAQADPALRTFGALAMQHAALRATSWRGTTIAFPGLH
jgi:hypothetical protein